MLLNPKQNHYIWQLFINNHLKKDKSSPNTDEVYCRDQQHELSLSRAQLKVRWHMHYFVQIQVVMLRLCDVIHLRYLINILGSVLERVSVYWHKVSVTSGSYSFLITLLHHNNNLHVFNNQCSCIFLFLTFIIITVFSYYLHYGPAHPPTLMIITINHF